MDRRRARDGGYRARTRQRSELRVRGACDQPEGRGSRGGRHGNAHARRRDGRHARCVAVPVRADRRRACRRRRGRAAADACGRRCAGCGRAGASAPSGRASGFAAWARRRRPRAAPGRHRRPRRGHALGRVGGGTHRLDRAPGRRHGRPRAFPEWDRKRRRALDRVGPPRRDRCHRRGSATGDRGRGCDGERWRRLRARGAAGRHRGVAQRRQGRLPPAGDRGVSCTPGRGHREPVDRHLSLLPSLPRRVRGVGPARTRGRVGDRFRHRAGDDGGHRFDAGRVRRAGYACLVRGSRLRVEVGLLPDAGLDRRGRRGARGRKSAAADGRGVAQRGPSATARC